jgi:hypothetical protein
VSRQATTFARYRGRRVVWACYTCGGRFRRGEQLKDHRCRPLRRRVGPRRAAPLQPAAHRALRLTRDQPTLGEAREEDAGAEVEGEEVEGVEVEVEVEGEGEVRVEGAGAEEPAGAAGEPAPSLPCASCDERFASKRDLGRHMSAAHPHVLHKCDHCPAILQTKKML